LGVLILKASEADKLNKHEGTVRTNRKDEVKAGIF